MTHARLSAPALAAAITLALSSSALAGDPTATYRVTFESTWTAQTHPKKYPGGAHFSPLIGAVHDPATRFWRSKKKASKGMEVMAEKGGTFLLTQEINAAIQDGEALSVLSGSGIGSPASTSIEFTATDAHSAVTLVSMIAPSPDWFVGVSALPLKDEGGWIDTLEVPLFAYDAGTDDGKSFTSKNDNTKPKKKIKRAKKGPLKKVQDVPFGRFVFERIGG